MSVSSVLEKGWIGCVLVRVAWRRLPKSLDPTPDPEHTTFYFSLTPTNPSHAGSVCVRMCVNVQSDEGCGTYQTEVEWKPCVTFTTAFLLSDDEEYRQPVNG